MFEKGSDIKFQQVSVTLLDGTELLGKLNCGLKPSISQALNSEGQFIELQDNQNAPVFFAKNQIASVEPVRNSGNSTPKLERALVERLDWHAVLGVRSSATAEQVKEAYHGLARQYHPDLYAGAGMPGEIRHYANEMFSRINVAYEQFKNLKMVA
ncbi:MAG: J domain-containing protein [Pseudomonadota bacterium]